jgi:DNA modification methylase
METNVIYCGDCLLKLKEIPSDSIDLIYIDPPFSSNRNYVAFWQEQEKRHFEDRFENVQAYLDYMKPRVIELYRVLKTTGSFYYHCDWHASHYIKVLLDRDDLFGYSNFRNDIIWRRATPIGGKVKSKMFPRDSDHILLYCKDARQKVTFNNTYIPYREKYVEKFFYHQDPNGRRYALQTLGDYSEKSIEEFEKNKKIFTTKKGTKRLKQYLDESKGMLVDDIWEDIRNVRQAQVQNMHRVERLGYPTQKPEALLERIIEASTKENDIVLDAFCGCGTTLVTAQRKKRRWIGIDISPTACRVMAKRLEDTAGLKEGKDFIIKDLPKTIEELRVYPAFEFQNWAINALGGVPSKIKVRDKGIDGKLYPIEDIKKEKKEGLDLFGDIDRYIPIQVKRTDQVGRPDIENFEVAMKRDKREKGI